ncbi:MAG: polysaccharide biosynthesis protein [Bacteroidales bacterium]|nr:polysaccharide biosynthesis protein [Bacteroidales bacterium]
MINLRQNTPRWLIFLIDMTIVFTSVILAYLLRFNFDIPPQELDPLPLIMVYILAVRAISFLIAKSYTGIVRHTSTADALRVLFTLLAGSIWFGITNIGTYFYNHTFFIPFSIIIIDLLASTFGMITFRMVVKIAFLEFMNPVRSKVNVIIYGAGEGGITARRVLARDAGTKYKVLAFVDDDPAKAGKKLEGIDIIGPEKLENLLQTNTIAHVILSIQRFDPEKRDWLVDLCLSYNTKVLTVPPMIRWINGELSFKQIRKIHIEELLERDEISLDDEMISRETSGKVIMVTGASGSIGSEIVRQLVRFRPKKLILIDQAETPLHFLELEWMNHFSDTDVEFILGDITNEMRMNSVFEAFRPEVVYHAAAYKHVPMMEANPVEAVLTNVLGTRTIADLAVAHGTSRFIMISTDKAVNPTSVMGAAKRMAEIYIQSLDKTGNTRFITTRFGNVLGSNGSVIPLFRSQIESGGPVTITHPEITRFFMTITEACRLVLEAGAMGKGGEIFIFDMGKSVRILDLAKKMIQLSGLTLGKDIQIRYVGLRPGEKLYEELLNKEENTLPTHHERIMIAKVREYDLEEVKRLTAELIALTAKHSNMEVVRKLKEVIPEYKSQNSVYEELDINP